MDQARTPRGDVLSQHGFVKAVTQEMEMPLSLVSSAAGALRSGCPNEEREFWLGCIARNVLALQTLMEDFGGAVDEETSVGAGAAVLIGHLELEREEVNLAALARQVVEDMRAVVKHHTLYFEGGNAWVWGDRERLRLLMLHLVSNAVKHSDPGREIKVDVWRRGAHVCLLVQDEGQGPTASAVERMFLPFARLESEGVAMALVRRIADAHGATVRRQGAPGQGTILETCFKALDSYR